MVLNTTRWSPDTCECSVEYDWDSETTEANRVHTLKRFVNVCAAHASLPNDTARWNTLFNENPRKSRSLESVLANAPNSMYDIVDGVRQLKPNLRFDFFWTGVAPNRVLNISFPGISLTTNQRNTIQNVLNNRFGVGQVILA